MKLKYELSKDTIALLSLEQKEEVWYASPYDLDADGNFGEIGYVIVTEKRVCITKGSRMVKELPIGQCKNIRSEIMIQNGIVINQEEGVDTILFRFSMKHVSRFSYITKGIQLLANGEKKKVVSHEVERVCERCGRATPGTSICPHCDGHFYTFKRFWDVCDIFQMRLVLITILMVIAAGLNLLIPDIQKRFIDSVLVNRNGGNAEIFTFVTTMLALTTLLLGVNLLRNWWCATMGAGISKDLRSKLYLKVQSLSMSFMQKRKPGEIMNRINSDTMHIRWFMEDIFSNMISTMVTMVGALIGMLLMSPLLTVCATMLFGVVFGLHHLFRKRIHRMFRLQGQKQDKMHSALQDVISGIRVVKAFGKEKEESVKFRYRVDEYARVSKKNETFWAYFFPILTFIMGVGVYLATYFGGVDVLNGRMTNGQLVQFITYTNILFGPMGWMNRLPRMMRMMLTSLERIYDVLDEEPEINNVQKPVEKRIEGDVTFEKVTFGYKPYEPVLKDINLTVSAGEMIGLVGPSGAGKSTLINLVMRLYDVDAGMIKIDGHDIKEYDMKSLHSQIGVVLQETFLFSDTVLNNLRFSKPEATMEEIISATKAANAHDFILKMPDGYNTYVGEHGYNVSGGQRQRMAIARAILNNPRILILDEATSALDTESEFLIQQAMERLQEGRTTFAIAHRLSTLRKANRLVVIDGHSIAEVGSHNELLEQKGIYYGLVNAQLEMQRI